MALRDQPLLQGFTSLRICVPKTQEITHRGAVDSKLASNLGLGDSELLHQLPDTICPLDDVQIFPLEVLNQGPLGRSLVVNIADNGWNMSLFQFLKSPPTTFASDQFKAIPSTPNDDRLHQPGGLD